MNPARQSSPLAGIKARCAQVLLCMLCSPAPHNTSLSFTLEESVHSRQEAAGGGVLPIRSMFAHACARVPPVWPRACLGLAWVHQTGAPPHKPYACLQSCMLQAQSWEAALYDQLRMLLACWVPLYFCLAQSRFPKNCKRFSMRPFADLHVVLSRLSCPNAWNTPGILHLPLTRSLERATELVYTIKRLRQ